MAWNRPTLAELIARVESDFSTKFFGTAAALRRGVLRVLARVWAGGVYLLHLYPAGKNDQGFAYLAGADQLDCHGQGVGKRLMRHAIDVLGATRVDVNEQNPQAVGFYQHLGFVVTDRSRLDGGGRPFPILHMKLAAS